MEQRPLGRTGLNVSALGFGCGAIGGLMVRGDPADQRQAVARALDAGITYFDTAAMYGNGQSEQNLGRVLRELDAWSRVVAGTKVRVPADERGDLPGAIERSLQASLQRLGRDSIDLLQLHNSIEPAGGSDRGLSVDEVRGGVAEGMRRVVAKGLARHAGFTGLGDPPSLHEAARSGVFETMQSYFNVLNPSAGFAGASGGAQDFGGLIDTAASSGLGVIGIRVMAAGAVTARPERPEIAGNPGATLTAGGDYTHDLERAAALQPLAAELGLESTLELAFRFALAKPGISTALVGYSDIEQLESAIRWAERGPLSSDVVERVLALTR